VLSLFGGGGGIEAPSQDNFSVVSTCVLESFSLRGFGILYKPSRCLNVSPTSVFPDVSCLSDRQLFWFYRQE